MEKMKKLITPENRFLLFGPMLILFAAVAGGLKNEFYFLIFFLGLIFSFLRSDTGIPLNSAWFFLSVWMFFSAFFSFSPEISFYYSFRFFCFYLFYSLFSVRTGKAQGQLFIFSILIAAFISSVILFVSFPGAGFYTKGIIGANKNYTSVLFALSFLYFLREALFQEGIKRKVLFTGGGFYFLLCLFVLNSRGAWLSVYAGTIFLAFIRGGLKPAFLVSLSPLVFFLLPSGDLVRILKLDEPYSYMRPELWAAALRGFASRPVLGFGPGLFENVFAMFKFSHFDGLSYFNHTTLHAHSEVLNLAAESGLPGALFFVWLFFKSFFPFKNDEKALFKIFSLSLFLQGLFDTVFYLPLTWLLFAASIALSEEGKREKALVPRALLPLSFIFIFPAIPFFLPSSSGPKSPVSALGNEISAFREIEASGYNSARRAALAELFSYRRPFDPFSSFEAGYSYFLGGCYAEAELPLLKAKTLEPAYAGAHLALAALYLKKHEPEKAGAELSLSSEKTSRSPVNFYEKALLDFNTVIYENLRKEAGKKWKSTK